MSIIIKTDENIKKMREAGRIVALTHEKLKSVAKVGMSTQELDAIAEDFIRSHGATPSFKGYRKFPASICASINEVVIHGIPSDRKLQDGDIIGIDIGAYKNGFHGDAARTLLIGDVAEETRLLVERTEQSFFKGIELAYQNHRLHEISEAIFDYITNYGYTSVREFCGHGIGKNMHEDPQIPNYPQRGRGPRLTKGMTLAIEPMINLGTQDIMILDDTWTVVTRDGKPSSHYENTILITDGAPELLTVV